MARPQDLCEFVGAMSWKSRQITSQKAVPLCLEFILKIVEAAAGLDGGDVMVTWVRPLPLSGLGLGAERDRGQAAIQVENIGAVVMVIFTVVTASRLVSAFCVPGAILFSLSLSESSQHP